jgi:hypothetical protein
MEFQIFCAEAWVRLTTRKRKPLSASKETSDEETVPLQKRLLEHNRTTFGQFMQDLTRDHEKQIEVNRQMRLEIKNMKLRVQEVENYLTYLKSLTNPTSWARPNLV